MKVPPTTAITSPNTTYTTATFVPKILIKRIKLPRSTIGDESKKDIHEKNAQYLSRCRKAALFSSEKLGWKILDCSDGDKPKTIDEIYSEIVTLIEEAL